MICILPPPGDGENIRSENGGMEQVWLAPGRGFFEAGAVDLAPRLLGCLLENKAGESTRSGLIVEVEAYSQDDPASHAWRGRTARNWPMFERGGLAYVYFIYGMHTCFNVTAGPEGRGEAVLVRALEPLCGIEEMIAARGARDLRLLTSGPGRLCRALGIALEQNGSDLSSSTLRLFTPETAGIPQIGSSVRIGISRAAERPWRFYLRGSPFLSRRSS
jgi:DNA-3-methyladenine glycosylase